MHKRCGAIAFMSTLLAKLSDDYKPRLRVADFVIIFAHVLVGLIFVSFCSLEIASGSAIKEWINGYYFLMPFALIGLFFRNLRRLKFYLVWVIIGMIQLPIYYSLKDNQDFQFFRGNAFSGLKALLPALIVFQILRLTFFNLRGQEMIVTMSKGRMTMWEEEEKRNMTLIEVVFSLILMGTIILFDAI
jgi:hypothetical protein